MLFIDIANSTQIASEVGDRRWRSLLGEFRRMIRAHLRSHRGQEQDTAGDGFFTTFRNPARAVMAASRIIVDSQRLGMDVRCGIHTGEVEFIDGKPGGIAAHIGARVTARASPAQILVTSTVHDLTAGSGIAYAEGRAVELKGVPGTWTLFPVVDVDGVALPPPLDESDRLVRSSISTDAVRTPLWWTAAVGTVVVIAVVVAGWRWQQASGPEGESARPSPSHDPITMLRLDPDRNEVIDEVRDRYLGVGRADPLYAIDGTLWQLTPAHVVRRDLATGEVLNALTVPGNTLGSVVAFGSIWHLRGDVRHHTLVRVDPLSGRILREIDIDVEFVDMAFGDEAIWVLAPDARVLEISPQRNAIIAAHETGLDTVPDFVAPVGDQLWICECDEGRLVRFDPRTSDIETYELPVHAGLPLRDQRIHGQGTVEVEEGVLWLIDVEAGTVTPFDTVTGTSGRPLGIPAAVDDIRFGVAFGLGSLWLPSGDSIYRIDLSSRQMNVIEAAEGVQTSGIGIDDETRTVWISACRCDP